MQLQTTSPKSKFPGKYIGVIFIQIDQHLKKLLKKYKGVPILWNMVYIVSLLRVSEARLLIKANLISVCDKRSVESFLHKHTYSFNSLLITLNILSQYFQMYTKKQSISTRTVDNQDQLTQSLPWNAFDSSTMYSAALSAFVLNWYTKYTKQILQQGPTKDNKACGQCGWKTWITKSMNNAVAYWDDCSPEQCTKLHTHNKAQVC